MKLLIIDTQNEINIDSADIDALNEAIDFIHPDTYEYGSLTTTQYKVHLDIADGAEAVKLKLVEVLKCGTLTPHNLEEWVTNFIDDNREEIISDWKSMDCDVKIAILNKVLSLFECEVVNS